MTHSKYLELKYKEMHRVQFSRPKIDNAEISGELPKSILAD